VAEDADYCGHPTPAMYGFQSYISMPITLKDGTFFGTLCAIDPHPARVKTPEALGMFKLFAELIASHLNARDRLQLSEAALLDHRRTTELREQFIAVLGHDLRNPLAAIDAGVNLLRRKVPPDREVLSIIDLIHSSVMRMSELIDNVLDFARGRLSVGVPVEVSLQPVEPVLQQVVNEMRAAWPNRAIETHFTLHDEVACDRGRLAQLFSNLLGNALLHGAAAGAVVVTATTDGKVFELSIANSGNPIPPAAMEYLFQPFYRAKVRRTQQGLGLGLYIASEIAKAHGGTLEAQSHERETRFTFRMPIR
jgi:signal transduction histidine kinase